MKKRLQKQVSNRWADLFGIFSICFRLFPTFFNFFQLFPIFFEKSPIIGPILSLPPQTPPRGACAQSQRDSAFALPVTWTAGETGSAAIFVCQCAHHLHLDVSCARHSRIRHTFPPWCKLRTAFANSIYFFTQIHSKFILFQAKYPQNGCKNDLRAPPAHNSK